MNSQKLNEAIARQKGWREESFHQSGCWVAPDKSKHWVLPDFATQPDNRPLLKLFTEASNDLERLQEKIQKMEKGICKWSSVTLDGEVYQTQCGGAIRIVSNKFTYCPYCGKEKEILD